MTPVDKKFRQKTHVFLQPIEGTLEPQGVKIAQFALLFTKLTPLLPVRLGVGLFVFGDSKHDVSWEEVWVSQNKKMGRVGSFMKFLMAGLAGSVGEILVNVIHTYYMYTCMCYTYRHALCILQYCTLPHRTWCTHMSVSTNMFSTNIYTSRHTSTCICVVILD